MTRLDKVRLGLGVLLVFLLAVTMIWTLVTAGFGVKFLLLALTLVIQFVVVRFTVNDIRRRQTTA